MKRFPEALRRPVLTILDRMAKTMEFAGTLSLDTAHPGAGSICKTC